MPQQVAVRGRAPGRLCDRDTDRVTLDDTHCIVRMRNRYAALPDRARIRTANKFQGQEAPIVLSAMTSSTAKEVPESALLAMSAATA